MALWSHEFITDRRDPLMSSGRTFSLQNMSRDASVMPPDRPRRARRALRTLRTSWRTGRIGIPAAFQASRKPRDGRHREDQRPATASPATDCHNRSSAAAVCVDNQIAPGIALHRGADRTGPRASRRQPGSASTLRLQVASVDRPPYRRRDCGSARSRRVDTSSRDKAAGCRPHRAAEDPLC